MTNVSRTMAILIAVTIGYCGAGSAQERIKLDYSSVDASNAVWYTAQEARPRRCRPSSLGKFRSVTRREEAWRAPWWVGRTW